MEQAISGTQRELDNLTKLRFRDQVSEDRFLRQSRDLAEAELKLKEQLAKLASKDLWLQPGYQLISLCNRAVSWFRTGTSEAKRLIIQIVGSNPVLKDGKLSIHARKPFREWDQPPALSFVSAYVQDVRTFFLEQTSESIELAAALKRLFELMGEASEKAA